MAKKNKGPKTSIDFDIGIGEIIPATQEAFDGDNLLIGKRKEEKTNLTKFKENLRNKITSSTKDQKSFPSDKEVFIFVFQYFIGRTEYTKRDIDNMAKTVLDALKGLIYVDDCQVRTLLIGKKIERRVPQNFAYIAVKLLGKEQDVDALKISGLERSVTMFEELKKQGLLT